MISNTFFGCRATLFNDHGCGYPVFGQINHKLVPSYSALCRPAFIPVLRASQRFLLGGSCAAPGFACIRLVSFKPFWPPALMQQALVVILLAALRRFRGAALFRGLRPSSSPGAPFWPSGLTRRSSGLAFGQPLTLAVRFTTIKYLMEI